MARTNRHPNPSAKNNATGYFGNGTRITNITGLPRATGFSIAAVPGECTNPRRAVTAGQTYAWSIYVKAVGGTAQVAAGVNWYTAGGYLSYTALQSVSLAAGQVARLVGVGTAPATADEALINVGVEALGAGATVQVGSALYEDGTVIGSYFDGDSGAGYAWTGTSGNSTSTGPDETVSTEAAVNFSWGSPDATWSDEFDYTGAPNPSKWLNAPNEGMPGHNGNGRRVGTCTTIESGMMRMRGLANGDAGWCRSLQEVTYGRWEVRSRSFNVAGATGANYHVLHLIWPSSLLPPPDWPQYGEYDWLEINNPDQTFAEVYMHYPHPNLPVEQEIRTYSGVNQNDWHNYALEWTADHLKFYIDGVLRDTFSGGAGPNGRSNIQAMPAGHYTAQVDNFNGASGNKACEFQIEWFRFYTLNSAPPADAAKNTRSMLALL